MASAWWDALTPAQKYAHALKCVTKHNAQTGRPHSNPEGVREGVQRALEEGRQPRYYGTTNPNWRGGTSDPYDTIAWRKLAAVATARGCELQADACDGRIEGAHLCQQAWCRNSEHIVGACDKHHKRYDQIKHVVEGCVFNDTAFKMADAADPTEYVKA